ncbi:MAG: hypothetical protein CHACPFDD_03908 [Phycisphaerae bacterium]|nr:hypothetical protein [Phycisphaerae bacterium]
MCPCLTRLVTPPLLAGVLLAQAQTTPPARLTVDQAQAALPRADLRVTRVQLFSSGVGYFECEGSVSDVAAAELSFRTDQINDIIKSLVVQDFDGGNVSVVSYASRDPIEKTLKSFGVDITGKPTLAALLDQLRGEPIEISGPRVTKGVVLGVEKQKIALEGGNVIEHDLLNVLTDTGIVQLKLSDVGGVRLANEKVSGELAKALATLASGHDADKKSVMIRFDGAGTRRVRAGYLLEAPLWKTSYRLVMSEKDKPFLQGWATVENATEADWRDVRLSLISGRPISFRMDLYSPIYVPRPEEKMELYASLRPPEYEGGQLLDRAKDVGGAEMKAAYRFDAARGARARRAATVTAAEAPAPAGGAGAAEMDDLSLGVALANAGVTSVAQAEEAGELFEYAIRAPVSLARQHSAMLPIVNAPIDAEKVSIYNPATHTKYPLNGLYMTNSTGLSLMQGPITIFDADVYAGDAKMPDIKPAEKRLLAYALDLALEVIMRGDPRPSELVQVWIAKGTLWYRYKHVDARQYVVSNKDDAERNVIIEQTYGDEWKLVEPKEPFERTQSLSRFRLAVPPGKSATLPVVLEQVSNESVALSDVGLDQIELYARGKNVSPKLREALSKVVEMRTRLDQTARARQETERQFNESVQEQGRIRENLKTLDRNSDTYQRQLEKFSAIESEIDAARKKRVDLQAAEEQQRRELETYLQSLDVQ